MKRLLATFLVLAGTAGVACYQDDALHPSAISPTKVFITDAPFPFDTVGSVNIYVKEIAGATVTDTSSGPIGVAPTVQWMTIVAPRKRFDLLTLQQGVTAFVGQQTIDAGRYVSFRMIINADSSSIIFKDGSSADVSWPYPYAGEIPLYALVDRPVDVPATGGEIVIDFDVGRSFLYGYTGPNKFSMPQPSLRAVNSAATGTIKGTVTVPDVEGNPVPNQNADLSVFRGDANRDASTWSLVATGRTDALGHYQVPFLDAGNWIVRVEQPKLPGLAASITPSVWVSVGNTTTLDVQLARAAVGTFLHITGPSSIGFGGSAELIAAVGDSSGIPEAHPQVTWATRDPTVATLLLDSISVADSASIILVLGAGVGSTWIVATSGALEDSVPLQVINTPPSNPVASITLSPAAMTLAKGDSNYFTATLRDSAGNVLTTPQVSWFFTDSSGVASFLWASGDTAWIHANISGSTHLRAGSQSKFKDATITVP